LIHGQVVVKWVRYLDSRDILIVDDALVQDEFMQRVLHMAAPPGVRVRVMTVRDAVQALTLSGGDDTHLLVLVKSPETALGLLNAGVSFQSLNVGGMAAAPGTTRLFKSVSASAGQLAALEALRERGVRVYIQMVPEERPLEMSELLPRSQTEAGLLGMPYRA
jgi:PTS system mannose-specific IIB component